MDWLKKAIKPIDVLIALAGIYLLAFKIDYQNMDTLDKVYLGCFGFWFLLLGIRCRIYWKGQQ